MIKVAFWFDAFLHYTGGLNYIKNLLHALSLANDGTVKPYIFFTADLPADIERQFSPYATVVRTKLLQRRTLPWFFHKLLYKKFNSMALANAVMKTHGIDVVSHAWFQYKGNRPFSIISWIPDFQYLHLPELFPYLKPGEETQKNQDIIRKSDLVVLSSNHALGDFLRVAPPGHESKGAVLRFVCQPSTAVPSPQTTLAGLEQKYGFQGPYFLLPNQFWAHKNHMVMLQAVARLKQAGKIVTVLCTGNTVDYRVGGTPYVDGLREFISRHGLEQQVRILGLIDYADVLFLMRHCVAVINPSRFEGWSSSVEEAKSMGKTVILSRIAVHVEQEPADGHYFDVDDDEALAQAMLHCWERPHQASQAERERLAREALEQRTLAFGKAYMELLKGVVQAKSNAMNAALRSNA